MKPAVSRLRSELGDPECALQLHAVCLRRSDLSGWTGGQIVTHDPIVPKQGGLDLRRGLPALL